MKKKKADILPIRDFGSISCPTCGLMCLGAGGFGCIDKPSLLKKRKFKKFTKPEK